MTNIDNLDALSVEELRSIGRGIGYSAIIPELKRRASRERKMLREAMITSHAQDCMMCLSALYAALGEAVSLSDEDPK